MPSDQIPGGNGANHTSGADVSGSSAHDQAGQQEDAGACRHRQDDEQEATSPVLSCRSGVAAGVRENRANVVRDSVREPHCQSFARAGAACRRAAAVVSRVVHKDRPSGVAFRSVTTDGIACWRCQVSVPEMGTACSLLRYDGPSGIAQRYSGRAFLQIFFREISDFGAADR